MKKYIVKFTEEAMSERKSLAKFIKEEAKAPLTAERYMSGLKEEIKKLENSAEAIVIDENLSRLASDMPPTCLPFATHSLVSRQSDLDK